MPPAEGVRAAGEIMITPKGVVNVNTRSGHFMQEEPLVYPEEMSNFVQAATQSILDAGKQPGAINP